MSLCMQNEQRTYVASYNTGVGCQEGLTLFEMGVTTFTMTCRVVLLKFRVHICS